ncbi:hypothetical protein KIH77_08745 [Bifidobacterium sp. 82T24]|uniref:hypothetical protein n=1 Tax=Bifidobacterium pluvialisilvae TaxID=2834436 RepID=UPI001C574860|nr:hypothetical protein [Bifidobacterium pluvialisilvae]MBW3088809.1 hypothetical protein [Bifidobacterium pluvialisilvae]
MSVLYHGGVPGLKPGDLIEPGHSRDNYDDCPICRMRRERGEDAPIDATKHPNQVYCTPDRLYARFHASMYGRGDVYQVRPVGCELTASEEDPIESYRCVRLEVVRIVDASVELSWKERRRLYRRWTRADRGHGRTYDPNPLPRNATPEMLLRWQTRELANAEALMGGPR